MYEKLQVLVNVETPKENGAYRNYTLSDYIIYSPI